MLMIARRDIEKGEELSFFYPSTEWEMQAPFICLCGASNCIHVVAGARFLPLSTLETSLSQQAYPRDDDRIAQNTELHLKKLHKCIRQKNPEIIDLGCFVYYNFRCSANSCMRPPTVCPIGDYLKLPPC